MIKNNKWKILISSLAILLPSVLTLLLKDKFTVGMRGAWYFTWIMPLIMFILNVLCIIITLRDNRDVAQSRKILNMIFWIMPCISIYSGGLFLAFALGLDFNISIALFIILGVSFIVMGNYMPKTVRNRTFGIKLKWTIANDANWVATHRYGGKIFVVGGVLTLLLAFLPATLAFILFSVILVLILALPTAYSYRFYKNQILSGAATEADYVYVKSARDKKTLIISIVTAVTVLALVLVLMFIGRIDFACGEDSIEIKPNIGGGIEVNYTDIVNIAYKDEAVSGSRVSGYSSLKLHFGWYRNDELGDYTRYTYAKSDSAIIMWTEDDVIVISDRTKEATKALYDELVELVEVNK